MKTVKCYNLKQMKEIANILLVLFLIFSFTNYVSAITASIGNARMVLRANVGDTIEKTILVKNVNDEIVNIEISPSGDLEKSTKVLDNKFSLQPGEEKNARFTIKVTQEGTTETKINIKFIPQNSSEQGLGLSSDVVIVAEKGNSIMNPDDNGENNKTSIITGDVVSSIKNNSLIVVAIVSTLILVVLLIILLVASKKRNNKPKINEERIKINEEIKNKDVGIKPKKSRKK